MNYFDINLYPQGVKNKKKKVLIRQMDVAHRVIFIIAAVMTLLYIIALGRAVVMKKSMDDRYRELKARAADQRLTDTEKDNILFLLNKEKHEVIVGRFLRVLNKHKIRGMTVENLRCRRLATDMLFSAEMKSSGVSTYKVDDMERMIENMISDREYGLTIYGVSIQEMNIERGGLITVKINGKVKIFE